MKKLISSIFLICLINILNAQDYLLNFIGQGESTTIDSVLVENLAKGTTVTVPGGNTLRLILSPTGDNTLTRQGDNGLLIYPSPMDDHCTVDFFNPADGRVTIIISTINGNTLTRKEFFIGRGWASFNIKGLNMGLHTLKISSDSQIYTGKLLSLSGKNSDVELTYQLPRSSQKHTTVTVPGNQTLKNTAAETSMDYTIGDRLLMKGISGKFKTILSEIPTKNKTDTFVFYRCTDCDSNNYSTVKIGQKVWMAENLATTKYNDCSPIPLVTDSAAWASLSTPGYCWYNNDSNTYDRPYGALYNWFTVNTAKLCPVGWHVPTDSERFTYLETYLGGQSIAGAKMKETGTVHWDNPNTGTTNETGFTAVPGGSRDSYGRFLWINITAIWWLADNFHPSAAFYTAVDVNYDDLYTSSTFKQSGCSIRCIKD